ncbi:response regulator [Desulfuromonas sp. AOP6]|uniref:response regulator n=1 Tax=Desulfuromonas sp. AOP6 TaxID=1566351 RepID=UPI0012728ACF|nr:response regulator [Desulfuromonas sp. AOP6]BCA80715.1 hypothetical protein AOP6_2502 [Desulfuromonas sp. AOP6]
MLHDPQESRQSTILVIDDDRIIRRLVREALQAEGFAVNEAADGEEGLALFARNKPDTVLLDVVMPKMDGFETCAAMRQVEGSGGLPIIMMTGLDDVESIRRGYEAGATDFVTKPIKWPILGQRIRYMLRAGRAMEDLKRNEERYRALFNSGNDVICVYQLHQGDQPGRFIEANTVAVQKLGYSRQELQALTPADFVTSQTKAQLDRLADIVLRERHGVVELDVLTKQQQVIPFEINAHLFELSGHQTVLAIARDISERKKAEESLRQSEKENRRLLEQFRTLFDGIPDPLMVLTPELKILWANRGAARAIKGRPADMIGKSCHEVWHHRAAPCDDCHAIRSLKSGKTESGHMPTGDGRIWGMRTFPIKDEMGRVSNVIELAHDITEKIRLQTETIRAGHLAALGELAAGVAHEINNPINGIINYAQILANKAAEQSPERDISLRIIKESDRVATIVRNLLSFARERKDKKAPVAVEEILADSLALVETQLRKDGIRFELQLTEGLPPVFALKQQIQQVFLNLISNARYALNEKYAGAHQDKLLRLSGETICVGGRPFVRMTLYDQGTGIPLDIIERITNPFFSTKPHDKGTGLGLSISHGIVRDHDGRLVFDSAEGQYTRVVMDLPAVAAKGDCQDGSEDTDY